MIRPLILTHTVSRLPCHRHPFNIGRLCSTVSTSPVPMLVFAEEADPGGAFFEDDSAQLSQLVDWKTARPMG